MVINATDRQWLHFIATLDELFRALDSWRSPCEATSLFKCLFSRDFPIAASFREIFLRVRKRVPVCAPVNNHYPRGNP
jgi:hypothetical protein